MISVDPYRRVAEDLRREIEGFLTSIGLLCRVFARGKSAQSIRNKEAMNPGKYTLDGKLIQDAVGIRVVLYFPEDVLIVENLLRAKFICDEKSTTVDVPETDVFSVSRHNLIFCIPDRLKLDMTIATDTSPIDATFEVQIRTILSEGWHEVEHDLRYKRKTDWNGHGDLSRNLNGVVASLETAEWSMRKIFDDLAYRHYRNGNWEAMLNNALRMRVIPNLSLEICQVLDKDRNSAKGLLRINRPKLFHTLAGLAPKIPVTLDNMVYVWAHNSPQPSNLTKLIPDFLRENFDAQLPSMS